MPFIKEGQTVQWQNITQKTKDWETQTSSIIKKKQTNNQTNKSKKSSKNQGGTRRVIYWCSTSGTRRVAIFILYVISHERKMEGITYDKRNMSIVIRDMNIPQRFTKSWWRPWCFRSDDFNLTTRNPRLIFSQWYVCYQLIDWLIDWFVNEILFTWR
jgi:hypothetical protein